MAFIIVSEQQEQEESVPAVFDTGANAHCLPNPTFFPQAAIPNSLEDCHIVSKKARKGKVLIALKKADFILASNNTTGLPPPPIILRQVLLAIECRRGLISATKLTNDGHSLTFDKERCILRNNLGNDYLTVSRKSNALYEISSNVCFTYLQPFVVVQ